jgi:hypothetical protein
MMYFGDNMLKSILLEIKEFNQRKERIATYIIISEADTEQLKKELIKAKMMPDNKDSFAVQIHGLRVIRTPDIRQGMFAITGE